MNPNPILPTVGLILTITAGTGSTLNITGPDITPGAYELIHWTGTLTGAPSIGTLPGSEMPRMQIA